MSGRELDPGNFRKARAEEFEYIHKSNLYTKVPRRKALEAGSKVISVSWLYINKGDAIVENYRSRLVARDIKRGDRSDLFAATPSLEALRVIISMCASGNNGEQLMTNDGNRAYFCAPARRQVFVELPQEDSNVDRDIVGELNSSMYGTRDSAQNWGDECAGTMGS